MQKKTFSFLFKTVLLITTVLIIFVIKDPAIVQDFVNFSSKTMSLEIQQDVIAETKAKSVVEIQQDVIAKTKAMSTVFTLDNPAMAKNPSENTLMLKTWIKQLTNQKKGTNARTFEWNNSVPDYVVFEPNNKHKLQMQAICEEIKRLKMDEQKNLRNSVRNAFFFHREKMSNICLEIKYTLQEHRVKMQEIGLQLNNFNYPGWLKNRPPASIASTAHQLNHDFSEIIWFNNQKRFNILTGIKSLYNINLRVMLADAFIYKNSGGFNYNINEHFQCPLPYRKGILDLIIQHSTHVDHNSQQFNFDPRHVLAVLRYGEHFATVLVTQILENNPSNTLYQTNEYYMANRLAFEKLMLDIRGRFPLETPRINSIININQSRFLMEIV